MGTRLTDSAAFAHLWRTEELERIFEDRQRTQAWLGILAALARAQARLGIIPASSAEEITATARVDRLDLQYVAEQTRATSHSTLGLIRGLQRLLPGDVAQHVYYGATVQDLTDTWFGIVMRDVGDLVRRDLAEIERQLVRMASDHRETLVAGRTHGQPGAPVTFGFKAASWADEVRRHLERIAQGRERWATGQLGGAVGVLGFFGEDAARLRGEFCAEVGLADPGISWLTARDRIAEFAMVMSMVTATLARIGLEVYELARPEIGELHEPAAPGTVSSITMPHKRNPEIAEHLDTLARLVRASAGVLLESMVGAHERDGRTWKAEWAALPEVCLLTGTAVQLGRRLVAGLEVDAGAMRANLDRTGSGLASERVLSALSARLGKHHAQQLLHEALREQGVSLENFVSRLVDQGAATEEEIRSWLADPGISGARQMVDAVVGRAERTWASGPASEGASR